MSKKALLKDDTTAEADWFDVGTTIGEYTSGFYSGVPAELPTGAIHETIRFSDIDVMSATRTMLMTEAGTAKYVKISPENGDTNIGFDVETAGSFATTMGCMRFKNGTLSQQMNWFTQADLIKLTDATDTCFDIYLNGQINANKFYKKATTGSELYQYNNIVVDEEGNFEKQRKNIAIKFVPTEITLDTPIPIPEMAVSAMRSNFYHLDFRLILEKDAGVSGATDIFYNNGMQFEFSNSTANDVVFYNGLTWRAEHYYNATLEAQASYHKHANFNGNQITDALINSVGSNVQRVVLHGEGVFMQNSGSDLLNLKLATVYGGTSGYSVAAGSYMKIELKNEGA